MRSRVAASAAWAAIALLACAWLPFPDPAGAAPLMDTLLRSSTFTASDGARLHVLESCPGGAAPDAARPVVAFVPGWSIPASIWRRQLTALRSTHCVAALDPRGQGESEVTAGGYAIERRADDVREFNGRYPRVVLVGWSLGALEALECVHRHGVAPYRRPA